MVRLHFGSDEQHFGEVQFALMLMLHVEWRPPLNWFAQLTGAPLRNSYS
jgi:hypothetical protein